MMPTRLPMLSRLSSNGWTPYHLTTALIVILLAVLLTSGGWRAIAWEAFHLPWAAHIPLVPAVAVMLAVRRRSRWIACRRGDPAPGLMILAAGVLCWIAAWLTNLQTPFHLGTVLLTVGTAVAMLGRDVFERFFPCFLVLLLMVPLPETVVVGWIDPLIEKFLAHVVDAFYYFTGLLDTRVVKSLMASMEVVDGERDVKFTLIGYGLVAEGRRLDLHGLYVGLPLVLDLIVATFAAVFLLSMRTWARVAALLVAPWLGLIVAAGGLIVVLPLWVRAEVDPHLLVQRLVGWGLLAVSLMLLLGLVRWLAWARVPVERYTLAREG